MQQFLVNLAGKILVPFVQGVHSVLPHFIVVFVVLAGFALMFQQRNTAKGFATGAAIAALMWIGLPILVKSFFP